MRILTPTILAALLLVACRETPAPEVATATETTIEMPSASTMPAPQAPVTATETTAIAAPPTTATAASTTNPRVFPPTTPFPVTGSPEIVDRVPPQELSQLIAAGEAVVVDVRYADQYAAGHIPGAISMPLTELSPRANELPRGKLIVAYCTWPAEESSARAALELQRQGFAKVAALLGGMDAWTAAGYPLAQ